VKKVIIPVTDYAASQIELIEAKNPKQLEIKDYLKLE
jgi:hypothetical protein